MCVCGPAAYLRASSARGSSLRTEQGAAVALCWETAQTFCIGVNTPKVTYVDLVRLLRVLSVKSWQDLLADERLPCFLAVNVRCTRHTGGIILHLEGCHLLQLNCLPLKNVCDGDGEWFDVYLL